MFQCFETPDMGAGIFTFFLFQFVSKCFETIESVDLEIFSLYNFYVSMFRNKFETLGHILYIDM